MQYGKGFKRNGITVSKLIMKEGRNQFFINHMLVYLNMITHLRNLIFSH